MLIPEQNEEKKLVLGDYMTVHVSGFNENQSLVANVAQIDVAARNENFFQRIQKERKELNSVRLRGAA